MKFLSFVLTLSLSAVPALTSTVDCGQGKVPISGRGICIQPDYIEGCQSYQSQTQCAVCNNAYKLNTGSKKCDFVGGVGGYQAIPGCLVFDANGGKCTNCANGFKKNGTGCDKGHKNCATYGDKGTCTDCKNDYSLVLGHCRHNLLLGCRSEQSDHTCKDCFAPFRMNGNHCDIPHCKSYNDFGCVGCQCGYFLTPDRSCKQVTSGCIRYYRGVCSNCLPHYRLKGGSCQIDGCLTYQGNRCVKCDQKYEPKGDGCVYKNCYDWLDGKCLVCLQGFRKQNDDCVKINEQELKCM